MMKLITPIIYTAFLIPLTGMAIGVEALVRATGMIGEYKGVLDLQLMVVFLGILVLLGIPTYVLANWLIKKIEKPEHTSLQDHFRQSFFLYAIFLSCLIAWVLHGSGNTEGDGYLFLWAGISLTGVTVNYKSPFR